MRIKLFFALFGMMNCIVLPAQEYTVITSVESIIPAGIGRSRIIYNKTDLDASQYTTERTEGTDSKMAAIKRADIKVDNFEETKLLNFFSLGGINFQNVASNDALIAAKLNEMTAAGWQLVFVVSGVESDGGETDEQGIYITRFIFKRG
ncbi:MAG TPA: hypothetical protein VI603_03700 [Saprospiraceae bacterium]|nr:hypothetical protein [Saprospiraceae bacterium]